MSTTRPFELSAASLRLDPTSATPLYRQVYAGLRGAILDGRLPGGMRLPSTRALAEQLGLARNTVSSAYEQLFAEGYVEASVGSGTFVSRVLPEDVLRGRSPSVVPTQRIPASRFLSRRGALLAATPVSASRSSAEPRAFRHGLPAMDQFPFRVWSQLAGRRWRNPPRECLGYAHPAGYPPLRAAIADYLTTSRGVRCAPEQVIIVAGSQQALDLAARVLLDPGDVAWIEDPGYLGARGALSGAGARLVPVPVDAEGIDFAASVARDESPRLVYVTPSHQYPLGVTMSLARRLALLDWARRAGTWVLEDDYDSEFRYAGRPLAALQGLDDDQRVIYLGTFSKVLLPSLRLGYLVVPPDLVDAFVAARALVDRHSPSVEQAALGDFLTEGHFARHLRRMRVLYAERQAALVEAAQEKLVGRLEVSRSEAGMHLVGWLAPGVDDAIVARKASERDVETVPVSRYRLRPASRGGLLLGYTGVTPSEIRAGVERLARALDLNSIYLPQHPNGLLNVSSLEAARE